MNILRDIFSFVMNHYEFFVLILLSIAILSLSLKTTKQQEEINSLRQEIIKIKLHENP